MKRRTRKRAEKPQTKLYDEHGKMTPEGMDTLGKLAIEHLALLGTTPEEFLAVAASHKTRDP